MAGAAMSAAPQLARTFKELGEYGKNPGREIRELERNVADELKRMRDFLNLVTGSVFTIGNRSPMTVVPVVDRDGPLVGGKSVAPLNLIDTTSARSMTLPARAEGLLVGVKDATGTAASQNILVAPLEDLVNIDGSPAADTIATDFGVVWYLSDGQDWWKV